LQDLGVVFVDGVNNDGGS